MKRRVVDTLSKEEMLELVLNKIRRQHTTTVPLTEPPHIDIILDDDGVIDANSVVEVVISYTEEH